MVADLRSFLRDHASNREHQEEDDDMLPVPQVSDLGHIELIAMTSLPSMAETLRKELLASLGKFVPEHPDSKCATTYATGPPHRGKPLRHIT